MYQGMAMLVAAIASMTQRLFIAIDIPDPVQHRLARLDGASHGATHAVESVFAAD